MKTLIVIPLTCLALAAGCASSDKVRRAESTSETNQKLQRETDHRLRTLEQSVNTLDTQVAQLNNRVYEVRTRGGQKTGMTVVPIIPPQPYKSAVATPAQPDAQLTAHGPVAVPTAEFAAGQQAASQVANPAGNPAAASQAATNPAAAQANGRPSIAVASTSATSGTTSGATSGTPGSSSASSSGSSSASNSGGVPVIGSASNSAIDPAATIRPIPAAPQRDAASAAAEPAPQQVAGKAVPVQPAPAEKPLSKAEARAIAKAEAKAAADAAKAEASAAKAAAKSAPTPVATPASSPPAAASFALPPEAATPAKPATAVQPMLPPVAAAGGNADVPVPAVPQSDLALPPEVPGLVPPLPGEAAPSAKNGATQNAAKAKPAAKATPAPAAPALAPAAAAAPAAAQPASLPKSGKGEEAAYKAALQPAMSGRPAESIGRFQAFLQEYPHGRFAANAEYWIGEGLYAQGKYGEALAQFQKVNSQWSSHHKNADALLKTGMTLSRMGDKEGAAQAYKKLLSQFPNSEAAGIARSRGLAR